MGATSLAPLRAIVTGVSMGALLWVAGYLVGGICWTGPCHYVDAPDIINPTAYAWVNTLMWIHFATAAALVVGYLLCWIPGVWALMCVLTLIMVPSGWILCIAEWTFSFFSITSSFFAFWPGGRDD